MHFCQVAAQKYSDIHQMVLDSQPAPLRGRNRVAVRVARAQIDEVVAEAAAALHLLDSAKSSVQYKESGKVAAALYTVLDKVCCAVHARLQFVQACNGVRVVCAVHTVCAVSALSAAAALTWHAVQFMQCLQCVRALHGVQ